MSDWTPETEQEIETVIYQQERKAVIGVELEQMDTFSIPSTAPDQKLDQKLEQELEQDLDLDDLLVARTAITGVAPKMATPAFYDKTRRSMDRANKERQSRGIFGGLTLGTNRFHQLNNAWAGIDHGVHLIGGETNVGKSSFMRMIAWDIMKNNPKVHVRFYTIDDGEDYFFSCFIAQAANVPINAVDKPHAYINTPTGYYSKSDYKIQIDRAEEMYQEFLNGKYIDRFSFCGIHTLDTANWQAIEDDIRHVKAQLPSDIELCVFMDNFHDVEIPQFEMDKNRLTEEVAVRAGRLAEQLEIAIIGTVELKKNSQRRPMLDDIRGASKWKYKARSIILLYSEVGVGKANPRIYHERPEFPDEKASILEVHFAKAKGNSFKGRLFYKQLTEMGICMEIPRDQAASYALLIS